MAASAVTKLPQIAGSLTGLKNVISKLGSSTWFKGALAGLGTFFGFEWLTSGGLVESTSSALGVSETTGSILIIVALLGVGYLVFRFIDGKISESKGKR